MSADVDIQPSERLIGQIMTQCMLRFSADYNGAEYLQFESQDEVSRIFDITVLRGLKRVGFDKWPHLRRYVFGRIGEFAREVMRLDKPPSEVTPQDLRDALYRVSERVQEALRRLDPKVRDFFDTLPEDLSKEDLAKLIEPMFPICPPSQ